MKGKCYIFSFLFITALTMLSCQDNMQSVLERKGAITRSEDNNSELIDYYWYQGEKITIGRVPNKSYIIFKASDKDAIVAFFENNGVSYNASSVKKYYHSGIDLTDGDKEKAFLCHLSAEIDISPERAYDIPEVVYAAPFYYADDGKQIFPLTNLFYVSLQQSEDYSLMKKLADEYMVNIISRYEELPDMYVLACNRESKGNALEIANSMYETGLFEATEPSFMSVSLATPNDTYYGNQWNLHYQNQYGSYSPDYDINYNQAANASIIPNASNITIAVIDQGVELTHSDLTLHSFSWDGVNSSSPSVVYGTHGTNVAGIMGAITNNTSGISGIASGVKVMSLSHDLLFDASIAGELAELIKKAANQGAHVINNSWGLFTSSDQLAQAIDYAVTYGRDGMGCVLVFCSHNDSSSTMRFPASYTPEKKVLAVGATSYNGYRAGFSNYGTNLDIVAPGVNIPTTTTGNSWITSFTGTSAAAPHVSGVAALMLAWNPNLSYDEVGFILQSTANKSLPGYTFSSTTKVGGTWNTEVGHGLLNMYAALNMAKNTSYNSYGNVSMTGGQTNLNSGGSGYVGTSFTIPYTSGYRYYWSGSYTGACDRWYVTPNGNNSNVGNVSVYLNPGQSGVLAVTCRVYSDTANIGKATQYVYVGY